MVAILIPLLVIPTKLRNCHIRIYTDNKACLFVKSDKYASIFVRTAYLISSFLGSIIHVEHCPHRSSWEAITADNFTRAKTSSFLENQILSRFTNLRIPEILSAWMRNPTNNWDLPLNLLRQTMELEKVLLNYRCGVHIDIGKAPEREVREVRTRRVGHRDQPQL
jgi:hypothetical protein